MENNPYRNHRSINLSSKILKCARLQANNAQFFVILLNEIYRLVILLSFLTIETPTYGA